MSKGERTRSGPIINCSYSNRSQIFVRRHPHIELYNQKAPTAHFPCLFRSWSRILSGARRWSSALLIRCSPSVKRRCKSVFSSALMAKSAAMVELLITSMSLLAVSKITKLRHTMQIATWAARKASHCHLTLTYTSFCQAVPWTLGSDTNSLINKLAFFKVSSGHFRWCSRVTDSIRNVPRHAVYDSQPSFFGIILGHCVRVHEHVATTGELIRSSIDAEAA